MRLTTTRATPCRSRKRVADGLQDDIALFLGVVEQADHFAGEVHWPRRERDFRFAAAGGGIDEWQIVHACILLVTVNGRLWR